jgi:drug/metabolite transporter (DMT)-like permease
MEPVSFLGILFALASALVWGGGDFAGGFATRRSGPFRTLALSAFSGLVLLIAAALVLREGFPTLTGMTWAMLAGISGSIGIAALYRALSTEPAASVAPTAAVIGAVLPVVYSAMADGLPAPQKLAGFALALMGIWLVTSGSGSGRSATRQGLLLACLAGSGFGAFFIFIGVVDPGKIFTPLIVARSFTLLTGLALVWGSRLRLPSLRSNPVALLAGLLDAGGNLFYILARQYTRLDIVAVLASLYPATTVLLAVLILKEKISRRQGLAVLICLAAIALISL